MLLRRGENIKKLLDLLFRLHAWVTHVSISLYFTCLKNSAGNLDRHCFLFVFKKVHSMTSSEFCNSLPNSLAVLKNEKANFNVALRKCLNTHYFYSVVTFLRVKMIIILFYKMFIKIKLYKLCVYVYLWLRTHHVVFVIHLWIHGMLVSMYVFMHMLIAIIFILFLRARPMFKA